MAGLRRARLRLCVTAGTAVLLACFHVAAARVSVTGDTLLETGTNYSGNGLNSSIVTSALECSEQCRNYANHTCNIFVFCAVMEGCTAGATGPYPFGTCSLKYQDRVWPLTGEQALVYNIDRDDSRIPWTSGAPIFFPEPEVVEGWKLIRGVDLFGYYDYSCPRAQGPNKSPNILQCEWHGTAKEAAAICEEEPSCRGFAYRSNASTLPDDSLHSARRRWSDATFKGGPDFDLHQAYKAGNPSSVFYYKPGLHEPSRTMKHWPVAGMFLAALLTGSAAAGAIWLALSRAVGGAHANKPQRMGSGQMLLNGVGGPRAVPSSKDRDEVAVGPNVQLTASAVRSRALHDLALLAKMSFLHSQAPTKGGEQEPSEAQDTFTDSPPSTGWQVAPEQITICQRPNGEEWKAGEGGFGQVFKALQDGVTVVAVKRLHSNLDVRQRQAFLREIKTLRNLHSPHIVQFLGACLQPRCTMLVTEWMDESLWDAMACNHGDRSLGWYGRGREIALDVAKGLHYLHSRNLIHLDLKSSNILLRQGTAKISDVGFAKILSQSAHSQMVIGGTWAWAAPEVLLGRRSSTQADIYSFGVVMWELVTGESPVRGGSRDVMVPTECPPDIKVLLDECFEPDPKRRPTAREIVHRLEASEHSKPPQNGHLFP